MSETAPPVVTPDFPENVVSVLKEELSVIDGFEHILGRPLRPTDPTGSLGVFPLTWSPEEWNIGQYDPAITRYKINIQSFVKHGEEEEGVILHSRLAKKLRVMLYRDDDLRVRLASLHVSEDGVTERLTRWGVEMQRFLSNQIQGTFLFLAVTEMWIETEIV